MVRKWNLLCSQVFHNFIVYLPGYFINRKTNLLELYCPKCLRVVRIKSLSFISYLTSFGIFSFLLRPISLGILVPSLSSALYFPSYYFQTPRIHKSPALLEGTRFHPPLSPLLGSLNVLSDPF